ncbi:MULTISPECIES: hypothetical protein [Rhodomicrobium]|uniref:hypothetical protein n=1 Tax=Rhodomicrobium TaxID=1068 RepID=UPI000B4AEB89|nr:MULTISPECIES: hypothetical protein [Rhodomicrobium]
MVTDEFPSQSEAEYEQAASRLMSLSKSLRVVLAGAADCQNNGEHVASAIFLVGEIERELDHSFRACID